MSSAEFLYLNTEAVLGTRLHARARVCVCVRESFFNETHSEMASGGKLKVSGTDERRRLCQCGAYI